MASPSAVQHAPVAIRAGIASAAFRREVLDLFVSVARLLNQPKSLGEIYGLLFLSDRPLAMDDVIQSLQISKGSASQGLRQLRALGAIRQFYVPGDRRDHYIAELRIKQIAAGFIRGGVTPHLESGRQRLGRLKELTSRLEPPEAAHLAERLKALETWHKRAGQVLPMVQKILG